MSRARTAFELPALTGVAAQAIVETSETNSVVVALNPSWSVPTVARKETP